MIYLPVMFHMIFVFQKTDFIAHTGYITRLYQTHSVIFDGTAVVNPLFTILSLLLTRIFAMNSKYAELIVLAVNYIFLGGLITHELIKRNRPFPYLVGPGPRSRYPDLLPDFSLTSHGFSLSVWIYPRYLLP